MPSVIEREQYVKRLAPYHPQYGAGAVYAEEHIRQDVASYQSGRMGHAPAAPAYTPARAPMQAPPRVAAEQAERQLLRALVAGDSALAETVLNRLTPGEFWTEEGRALAARLYAAYAAEFEPDMRVVLADLEAEDAALANALTDLLMDDSQVPLTPLMLEGDIAHLETRAKQQRLAVFKQQITQGQADPDLLTQYRNLQKELKGMPAPA